MVAAKPQITPPLLQAAVLPFLEPLKTAAGPPLEHFDGSHPVSIRAIGKQLEGLLLDPDTWARGQMDKGASLIFYASTLQQRKAPAHARPGIRA